MILGLMALSVFVGASAAVVALMSGFSVLAALALYSGAGLLSVLIFVAVIALRAVPRLRPVGMGPADLSV